MVESLHCPQSHQSYKKLKWYDLRQSSAVYCAFARNNDYDDVDDDYDDDKGTEVRAEEEEAELTEVVKEGDMKLWY